MNLTEKNHHQIENNTNHLSSIVTENPVSSKLNEYGAQSSDGVAEKI
jgi:hypothetical protein